jgi:hypothetical protein
MIRATGRYRNQMLELDRPLDLQEGTRVVIEVDPQTAGDDVDLRSEWSDIGMSRLEEEWDNPGDAIYDDWRTLYGLPGG